ncbi:hypothetical protein T09_12666 [Trichinella sp. T9]|nr:hypothetical protein T09_12666 [Trichinella sp. T9]
MKTVLKSNFEHLITIVCSIEKCYHIHYYSKDESRMETFLMDLKNTSFSCSFLMLLVCVDLHFHCNGNIR